MLMKHTILISLAATGMALVSCNDDLVPANPGLQAVEIQATSYKLLGGQGYIALLKENGTPEDAIYVLHTNSRQAFSRNLEVLSIAETADGIDVRLDNGGGIRFSVDALSGASFTGYGLSTASGEGYYSSFYGSGKPLADPDVADIRCNCVENTNSNSGNCDAGGKGSTECNIEHGGTIVGNGISFKCSVKCSDGYYACCKSI